MKPQAVFSILCIVGVVIIVGSLLDHTFTIATVIVLGFALPLAWLVLVVLPKTKPS